ncbi:MAG: hypothetical protein QM296_04890 [Bacillota bacterium]|nr:hypothetical protein [Bacillota bacterium]
MPSLLPRNRGRSEKLSKGGQKLRWCPRIGAGTKKLATAGQKRAFVPPNRGRNEKIVQGWKNCAGAPKSGQERKI